MSQPSRRDLNPACGCSISGDVRIEKCCAARAKYAPLLRDRNGRQKGIRNCCPHVTHNATRVRSDHPIGGYARLFHIACAKRCMLFDRRNALCRELEQISVLHHVTVGDQLAYLAVPVVGKGDGLADVPEDRELFVAQHGFSLRSPGMVPVLTCRGSERPCCKTATVWPGWLAGRPAPHRHCRGPSGRSVRRPANRPAAPATTPYGLVRARARSTGRSRPSARSSPGRTVYGTSGAPNLTGESQVLSELVAMPLVPSAEAAPPLFKVPAALL